NIFNQLSFDILPYANTQPLFSFVRRDSNSVDLVVPPTLTSVINTDNRMQYQLYARVQDNGTPIKYDIALVTINMNRNRVAPRFLVTEKTVNITENFNPGEAIESCNALDTDSGENGIIAYLDVGTASNTRSFFQVIESTSDIVLKRDLDEDSSIVYTVLISAQDSGPYQLASTSTCTVTINVFRNRFTPEFVSLPYDTSVEQNRNTGLPVTKVTAEDRDTYSPFNVVRYELVRESSPGVFTLDAVSGDITLVRSLANQPESSYTLVVRAYDGGEPPRSAYNVVTITVNRNLNAPRFIVPGPIQNYQVTANRQLETIGLSDIIYQVQAEDDDSGPAGTITYELTGTGKATNFFQVNPSNGQIQLKASLLQDVDTQYVLTISARDNDPSPRSAANVATVTVNVYRNQFSPVFINEQSYSQTVNQNLGTGSLITTVTATDADEANTFERVTYEVIGDGETPGYVTVNNNGDIRLRSSLASLTSDILYVRVLASDNGQPPKTDTSLFSITLNKNLFAPTWIATNVNNPIFSYVIDEDQPLFQEFGQLTADDRDSQAPNNVTEFYSVSSQPALEFFQVTSDGIVSVRKSLEETATSSFTWTMSLRDKGVPVQISSTTAQVSVNVNRNRFDPFFTNCPPAAFGTIDDGVALNTRLFQLTFNDRDSDLRRYGNVTVQLIGDDNADTLFGIDTENYVVVRNSLDFSSTARYQLRILARDQGEPPRQTECVVPVNVNHNLKAPVFLNLPYSQRILENLTPPNFVLRVTADDEDIYQPYNQVSYSFGSNQGVEQSDQYFMVQPTGEINVLRDLQSDINKPDFYRFNVLATDGGGLITQAPVSIEVIRNTPPSITNNLLSVEIFNNHTLNSDVFDVQYFDPDIDSPFNVVTFSLTGELLGVTYFEINALTGQISLQRSLLGSGPDSFILVAKVCDGGNLCDSKNIQVNVQRNFFTPLFTANSYEVTIGEDTPVLTSIEQVQAFDNDRTDPYRVVSYRMQTSNDRFSIESNTGIIRVKKPLDGETDPFFIFNVVAEDGGGRISLAIPVKVNIIRNENSPVFDLTSCDGAIEANVQAGTLVSTVTARDADTQANFDTNSIRYSIIGDAGAGSFFSIGSLNGQIRVGSGIDVNSASFYQIRIQAQDGFRRSAIKVCRVTVNRNLNSPQFQLTTYSSRILETKAINSLVEQVAILDIDGTAPSNQGNFTLSGDASCLEYFQMDDVSGVLSVKKDLRLNPAKPPSYSCTVTASDRGIPPRAATNSAIVSVQVIYNQAPSFNSESYEAFIDGNTASGVPLVTYAVQDPNTDVPFSSTYVYISGGVDAKYFTLDRANQRVILRNAQDLAVDSATKYKVFLTVVDGGSPPLNDTAEFTLTVKRNLYGPRCRSQSLVNIPYTQETGVILAYVNATDDDDQAPMNQIRYSLVNQGNILQYFSIDPNTAAVSLKTQLPPNGISGFQIQVLAQDGGFPPEQAICTVQVSVTTDTGTLSFNLPNYAQNIDENANVNDNVLLATASPSNSVTYSIIGIDTGPTYFDINPTSGQIYVKANLRDDPIKRSQYTLRLRAERQFQVTTQEAFATATITVNRNLNSPQLRPNALYERTINEDAFIGDNVVQIDALDADNDVLRYEVVTPTSGSDFFAVSATTGLIIVAKPLTSVPQSIVQFNVIVSDQAIVNPKSATATIRIRIVPDAVPQFVNANSYTTTIPFNQPAATSIFRVSATDSDQVGNMVYEANCGTLSAPGYFDVLSPSGDINITNSVALDLTFTYELCLIAYDSARPNAQATSTMTINVNRNPNAPLFNPTSYRNVTTETVDYGTLMFTLNAQDNDLQAIQYEITSSSPSICGSYFNLHPDNGDLSTAGDLSLIPKIITECNFQFAASDKGNPPKPASNTASGVVTISRNNFPPVFPNTDYRISIPETTAVNTDVFNVNASDSDFGEPLFGEFDYIAIGDSPGLNFFQVNSADGRIRLVNNLAVNNIAAYQIRVVARDFGRPRLSGTTLVTIDIERNFADPVISPSQNPAITEVFEDDPISNPIFEFNAQDTDRAGPQRDVRWAIQFTTATDSRYFNINQQGNVFITVPLYFDGSDKPVYTFTVTATNTDGSGKFDSVNCQVNVKRNIFPPTFTQNLYSVSPALSYDARVGDLVTDSLAVSDNDAEGRYKVQSISIVPDSLYSSLFSINSVSGQITLGASLQTRTEDEYLIRVQAQDGGTPPLIGYTSVLIPVNRNQQKPRFTQGNQTITLLENQLGGEIGRVVATDDDRLEPYNKIEFTQLTSTVFYSTDSDGKIYLIRSLTETGSPDSLELQIRVCDLAPSSLCAEADAYVTINVIRNNHYPYFEPSPNFPYSSSRDSLSLGEVVIRARAADNDDASTIFGQLTFELIGDDGDQNRFDIGASTGDITVSNRPNLGESSPYQLRIQVCDGGGLCNVTVALVTVTTNRFPPLLDLPAYITSVLETQSYGVEIITVTASDNDLTSPNNAFEFELLDGTLNDASLSCFDINGNNGQIFAKSSLLSFPCNSSVFEFNVRATDKGLPSLQSTPSPVTISVIRNTAAPEWDQRKYIFAIDRNHTLNTAVGSARAEDQDSPNTPFGTLTYTVQYASSPLTFDIQRIDNNNINIMLRRPLGRTVTVYRLYVLVEDNGVPRRSGLTEIEINVNRNLNRPFFLQFNYNFDTYENEPVGSGVGTPLRGDDLDDEVPWSIYNFRLVTASRFFTLDTSGQLYTSRSLVATGSGGTSTYILQAQIYDGGIPSLIGDRQATITVRVFHNLQCPTFGSNLPATVNIRENEVGIIFTANATDADSEPRYSAVTYELAGVNPDVTRFFRFDRATGQVSVLSAMQFDQATSYSMIINAWDGFCNKRTQGKLTINVERNLYAPEWLSPSLNLTLLETQALGEPIYNLQLQASDRDGNTPLQFSFAPGSPNVNMFLLDTVAGVYLQKTLLGRNDDPYTVQFVITDEGGLTSGVFSLIVNVIRNQAPTISIPSLSYSINSNRPTNAVFATCQGFDPDTQDPFNQYGFYLIGTGDAVDMFAVNENNCEITATDKLSTDTATSYRVELQVRDKGTPPLFSTVSFDVNVERNLFSPFFQPVDYQATIIETIPQGQIFLTVTATDGDVLVPYNTVRYSIVSTSQDVMNYFDIDPVSGGIFCKLWQVNYPDNLPNNPFIFEVQASDLGPVPRTSSSNARVTVNVIRNTAPFFLNTNNYTTSISEAHPEGTSIYAVSFNDNDRRSPFNDLTLSIRGDGNAPTFFNIDNNGVIRLKNGVDLPGSSDTRFLIRVQVQDAGIPSLSSEAFVTVNVQRNFHPPELPSVSVSIPYNSFRGRLITTLQASDDDKEGPEATITYSILGGDQIDGIAYFFLNPISGALTLTNNTDLKNIDRFLILVRATDAGTPPLFAEAIVTVTILKETSNLTISDFNFQVNENQPERFTIGSIFATPSDGVQYITIGYQPAIDYFAVDASDGTLSVKQSLLGQRLESYTLVVRAVRDSGLTSQSAESTVTITVIRNLNGPVFNASLYEETIQDTTDIGSFILGVFADDADGDSIEYSFIPGSGDFSPFFLHPRSGAISLITSLFGTTTQNFQFQVQAQDNRSSQRTSFANIRINIVGDRSPPVFTRSLYTASFSESSSQGDGITVTASDPDLRGVLVFEVTGISTGPAYFGLGTVNQLANNQANARVVITDVTNLKADDLLAYTLRLITYDSRYPNTRDTATVSIRMNRNPSAPSFTSPNYFTTVKETIPQGTIIFNNINATDADGDSLRYSITGNSQAQEYYEIHPDTAVIRLKKSLQLNTRNSDTIQLQVSDQRNPQRLGIAQARVTIIRDNSDPVFININAQQFVSINQATPANFFNISGEDQDLRGNLVYTWVTNYSNFFELVNVGLGSSAVGQVNLVRPLTEDPLRLESYSLIFRVFDSEFPNRYDEKTLTVITNRNPNPPVCTRSTISRQIDVNTRLNQVLDTVAATDADGDTIRYSFEPSTDQIDRQVFYVDPDSGEIRLTEVLSTVGVTDFTFTVLASDQGYPNARSCPVAVRFTVDTDDAPFFRPLNYTWTGLRENAFTAQTTFVVNGFDDDLQGNLEYRIIGQYSEPYYFGVRRTNPLSPGSSGTLFVQKDLLPDNEDIYFINVIVFDDARPQLSATTTVTASVLRNPSGPSFSLGNYAATFHELEPVGYSPTKVSAVDSDGDSLTYSFLTVGVDQKPLEFFAIQPITGDITVKKRLTEDPIRQLSYVLRVQAVDDRQPQRSAEASVTLTVTRNRNSPVFINTPYQLINPPLSENTVPGPAVLYSTIQARDIDNRVPLVYEVVSNTSGAYFFDINRDTADLTLRNSLLSGANTDYTLYVRAYDPEYPLDYAEEDVTIRIARNEYSPVFSVPSYTILINETEPVGTNILTVQATDQNQGDVVTFSAVGQQNTLELFELFSSGSIIVKSSLLGLPLSTYQMNVVARDDGTPQRSTPATITINIIQYAGNPQILTRPCQQTFNENQDIGAIGTRIDVQDNPAGILVFEETGQYPAPSFFDIDNQGIIYLTRNVRNSTFKGSTLSYSVRVYDSLRHNRASVVTCIFTVVRNENAPTWDIADFSTSIKDSHPVLGDVIQVTASDIDPLDVIEYSLEAETAQRNLVSGPSGYFFIDANTGMIKLAQSVKGSGINSFTLTVKACDNGFPELCITKSGVISVDNTGATPVFSLPTYIQQIEETAQPGDFVLLLRATDSDMLQNSYLVYEFVNPPPPYFLLDERTGNLTVARSVFYDISPSYGFPVIAYDVSDPDRKARADVTIFVNRNPAGPFCQINPLRLTFLEYQQVPSIVGRLDGVDQNGDDIEFTLSSVNPPPRNASDPDFYVDFITGDIWLFNSMEGASSTALTYQLNVTVADKRVTNVKRDYCNVIITVNPDSPPFFIQNNPDRTISEFAGLGQVTNVIADDRDKQGFIVYDLKGTYPADQFFDVNAVTGSINLIKSLTQDGLALGSYTLTIEAYDSARPTRVATQNVVITVSRNANGPVFIPSATYTTTVLESIALASSVIQVTATDSDNEPLTYNITAATGNGFEVFFMDGDTIKTKADLRQASSNYQLTVEASDPRGRIASATVSIFINRVSADRPPRFSETTYTANINRYETPNRVVISTFATDPDIPNQQSRIKYEMSSAPGYSYFRINRDNGDIILNQTLTQNVNEAAFYIFELTAFDEQNPDLKARANAVIFVDFNPNGPVFSQINYQERISEYYGLGKSVLAVMATDADNDIVRYFMDQTSNDGRGASVYFSVDPNDGTIYVTEALTSAPLDRYVFRIVAYDNRSPMKTTSILVTIDITRDRFAPSCNQRVGRNVNENTVVNATSALFQFQASDADNTGLPFVFGPTGNRPSRAYFRVARDGSVYVNLPLTSSTANTFELEAFVYQEGFPQNVGICFATLTILRNLNAPVFTSPPITTEIFEYSPIGTEVADLEAIDADGDRPRYTISGDLADQEFFEVDDLTGRLTLRKQLSEDQNTNSYSFNVQASDDRSPPQRGDIPVTVNVRRDQRPQFVSPTPLFIVVDEEDRSGVTLSPAASAEDGDLIGQIRYGSTGENDAQAFFEINEFTGIISIRRDLSEDFTTSSYRLIIYAYDSGLPQVRSQPWTVSITVTRNQFPPEFVRDPYTFSIDIDKDGGNLGYLIGQVNATDRDGDIPYYTLTANDNSASYIFLDRDSGRLYLINTLSSLPGSQQQFSFSVVASDRLVNPRTDTAQITVNLQRDQFPPEFNPERYIVTIEESRPVNDIVVLSPPLSAQDRDLQGNINYQVTGTFPGNNFFDVGVTDGRLRIIRDLRTDTIARPNYQLTIEAFDSALPSAKATATVTVNVLRNVNGPVFAQNPVFASVDETHPIQVMVTNLTATDLDRDSIEYRLLSDTNSGDGLSFFYVEPSTGEMYIKRSLTQARSNTYNMIVRATDSGNPPKSTNVDVTVAINRVQRPIFSQSSYSTTVAENLPVSDSVFDMEAVKTGATIRYEATGLGLAPYFFAIDENTGRVTVRNSLRNFTDMSYSLTVKAYDASFPDFPTTSRLDIQVTRNDNEPAFNQSIYTATVTVDTPPFSNLVTVNAQDARDGDIITYSLVGPQQCLDSFRLLSTTGQFLLAVEPNIVPVGIYNCIVRATDNGYPTARTTDATVQVTVTTQNAPTFTIPAPVTIDETEPQGQVATLFASKANTVGNIRYEAVGNYPARSFFSVDAVSGVVTLTGDLINDPNKLTQYTLRVCAYDTAFPNIRRCADQVINVNRNQFGPTFVPTFISIPLDVDTNPADWSRILEVSDRDSSALSCSITSTQKAQEFFTVDPDTCVLSLSKPLTQDSANTTLYRVTVEATDNGSPQARTGTAIVEVSVVRDIFSPDILNLPASRSISENTPQGDSIFRGQASDQDQTGNMVCASVANYPASIYFRVDPVTCEVFVENSIRFDDASSYSIPIQVYDSAWPNNRRTKILTINVDRNENRPVFTSNNQAFINDQFPPGNVVLTLRASDADGDSLSFSKVNASQGRPFIVDPSTGRVILTTTLSGAETYSFNVQVSDNRTPPKTAEATVRISVTDVTFSPVWDKEFFEATININRQVNSVFTAQVRATKNNDPSDIKYRISGSAPTSAENFFKIDEDTGSFTLTSSLVNSQIMSKLSSVVLFIEAYDKNAPLDIINSWVTITFNRNLNAPEFSPTTYFANIADYDPTGTKVTTVSATDRDILPPENKLVYSLDSGRAGGWFTIDSSSGQITVAKRLSEDIAQPRTYELFVTATDQSLSPRSAIATVFVNVERNEAPRFQQPSYSGTAPDTLDIFSPILVASATDDNPQGSENGMLDFFIEDATARNIFFINNQGAISPRRQLDRLSQTLYEFPVRVSDRGIPSLSATASVTITIRESPGLDFIPDSVTYQKPENNNVPELLESFEATDGATGNQILYELQSDGFGERAFSINPNTGEIFQNISFKEDPERSLRYVLRKRAYRASDPSVQAYRTIIVDVDRNPSNPSFKQKSYTFQVPESQALGQVFGSINATDPDTEEAGELTYTISRTSNSPLNSFEFFYVSPTLGQLSVSRSLFFDRSINTYEFPVQVQDSGSPRKSDTATVTIQILRNTFGPVFSPTLYNRTITETTPVNTKIIDLNATEADNDRVTYSLQQTDTSSLFFNIDQDSGIITLSAPVLRAPTSVFTLTVTASDNRASPRTAEAYVTVTVTRNPSQPKFQRDTYDRKISEYQELNSVIITTEATDQDDSNTDSGRISYSIISQTALDPKPVTGFLNNFFGIGANNGDLYLARVLTTNKAADKYQLIIQAQDNAIQPKSATATVTITIQRNEHKPVFNPSSYNANITEDFEISSSILKVTASDDDSNIDLNANTPNAQIKYSLLGVQSSFFGITDEGIIFKRQPTSGTSGNEDKETFKFSVVASDGNWEGQSNDTATVSITVNYNKQVVGRIGFTQPLYYKAVKENFDKDQAIVDLDVENQGSSFVNCQIIPQSGKFTVEGDKDEKNCVLKLRTSLDREQQDRYDIKVEVAEKSSSNRRKRQAQDQGNTYYYNTWPETQIIIEVLDVNDNAPKWIPVVYPPGTTREIFITAISVDAPANALVTQLTATDMDLGRNGEVRYDITLPSQNPPPFDIQDVEGLLTTTSEFPETVKKNKMLPYKLDLVAHDRSIDEPFQYNDTVCYVNLIRDINRFILVVNKRVTEIQDQIEKYRQALQESIGQVVLIELIQASRVKDEDRITIESASTDITFVVAQKQSPYQLYNSTDDFAGENIITGNVQGDNILTTYRDKIDGDVESVHLPYQDPVNIVYRPFKSYIWWMDDPWAALVALAAIIILLALVGIIVIIFTHSRYMKFISQYRMYQSSYQNPDFEEPANFLREYETQSLNMYVPPDDLGIPDYGEVDMTLADNGIGQVQHTGHDPSVVAAVNPIYSEESGQQLGQAGPKGSKADNLTQL
ncbi:hypothetical protein RRG08_040225, partial [Elysia crispata]